MGIITALWLPYALLAWRYGFLCDDAFITYRYARNLARGYGLRFNLADPPVEGFSDPLWMLVAAACEGLLLPTTVVMPAISAACGAILVWRAVAVMHDRLGLSTAATVWAGLALATAPPFAVWATGGLETMPFALLVFLAFEAAALGDGRALSVGAPLALAGVAWMRAEGPAWAVVLLALAGAARVGAGATPTEAARALRYAAAGAIAATATLLGIRLAVFGDWVPNTVHAKVAVSTLLLERGLKYVGLHLLTFPTHGLALLAAPAALRQGRGVGLAVVALAVAFPTWCVTVGGDYFPMGRMLVAGLPFVALLAGYGFDRLERAYGGRALHAAGLAALVLGALPAVEVHVVPASAREALHFRLSDEEFLSEHGRWVNLVDNTEKFALRGLALAEHSRRGQSIVSRAIGAIGYYTELHVYDQFGLIDPDVANRPLRSGPLENSPGHDREVDAIWFADRDPDFLFARYVRGKGAAIAMDDSLKRWSVPAALRDRYVPDFWAHTVPGEVEQGYLFVVRRAAPGEDAAAQWVSFEEQRRALHRSLR